MNELEDKQLQAFPGEGYYGMDLRDWFAGQALVGLLAYEANASEKSASKWAYYYADAMMNERNKQNHE